MQKIGCVLRTWYGHTMWDPLWDYYKYHVVKITDERCTYNDLPIR